MRLKKFKAIIGAVVTAMTCVIGVTPVSAAEDLDLPTGYTNDNLKATTWEITQIETDGAFPFCLEGSLDAYEEYGNDVKLGGQYVDKVQYWANDLGISIGFDYEISNVGAMTITDIYGVVSQIKSAGKSDDRTLYIPDYIAFSGLNYDTVEEAFYNEENLIASDFGTSINNVGIKSITYSDKAKDVLAMDKLPLEKLSVTMGLIYPIQFNYDTLTFTGDGPDRISLYSALPTNLSYIDILGEDSHYRYENGCLIDDVNKDLMFMLPGAGETSYNDMTMPDGVKVDAISLTEIAPDLKTISRYAFGGIEFVNLSYDHTALIIPETVETVEFSAFDFNVAPDYIVFEGRECDIRTNVRTNGKEINVVGYTAGESITSVQSSVYKWANENSYNFVPASDDSPAFIGGLFPSLRGDANGDGSVSVADCVAVSMHSISSSNGIKDPVLFLNADVVADDVIDSSDATLLMNYISMVVDEL